MIEIKLPSMPEWAKMDNLGGLVPSEIRSALNAFAYEAVCLNAQAEPDEERLAMEAVMESVDPATWPGLTVAQRCALGRFAKPQPSEPVSKTDWNNELSSWSDEDFIRIFHERPDLANRLRKILAEPVKAPSDDLAHEIWAAAQTTPGEGIEDAVERVAALLASTHAPEQPLTDEQIYDLYRRAGLNAYHPRDDLRMRTYDRCINNFARAIEQAHGIGVKP